MSILGGLISTGLSILGSKQSEKAQRKSEERQFNYQRQLNAEMNAYNTPAAQMQRYVEAGINPYMASVSSGTQGSAGSVSTSSGYTADLAGAYNQGVNRDYAIKAAEMDLRSKALALQKQSIENEYLPLQIQSTINEVQNRSSIAKYQAAMLEHDYDIVKNQSGTLSKETGFWPRLDRFTGAFADKVKQNLSNSFNYIQDRSNQPWWKFW